MNTPIKTSVVAIVLAAVAGFAQLAAAAEVRAGISTRETYVGLPVTLRIQVSNASKFDPPTIPQVDGLDVRSRGTPAHSTQITSINGNTTTRTTVTYAYEVTPRRAGTFRIPPITIEVDGRQQQTRSLEFVASKSETGDVLFVEVAGKEKQIYVGQSLDLTLKIWLRPFRDRDHNVTLSEGDMWQMISERTSWGAFAERIQQLAGSRERPAGKEVLRKDRDGVEHSYYLYEIEATIYPKRPGKIEANDVQIVVDYPTALGQSRNSFAGFFDDMPMPGGPASLFGGDENIFAPFGSRLTVRSARPIVAEAKVEPIDVRAIPTADRPADYRGAVGEYQIVTEASPSSVKAGDPFKLLIGITGTGPMELVQAPPLAELPTLVADFKVPNEPLAGFVQGDRKVFSTTIRPRKAGIREIPAIPFSYFDPQAEKFVTVRSQPIPVHVEPADTLALDAVVGRNQSTTDDPPGTATADVADGSPRLAVFTGSALLINESRPGLISRWLVALLALPPLVVLGIVIRRGRHGFTALAGRFGSNVRQCQTRIKNAEQPAEVAAALESLLARRLGLGRATVDKPAVVGALRTAGYRTLAVRCERMLQHCERQDSRSFGGVSLSDLKRDALQVIEDLQTQRRPSPTKPAPSTRRASRLRSSSSTIVAGIVLAGTLLAAGGKVRAASDSPLPLAASSDISLTAQQQQTILKEANQRYNLALSTADTDSAEAKQAFADAAEKYQLLVDSGIHNSRLYFNLANAYLESGTAGRAIANYRRSLALDPTNREFRANLAYAESRVVPPAAAVEHGTESFADYASLVNGWLNRYIDPRIVLVTAISAWFALWGAIGLRLLDVRFPWKTASSIAVVLFAAAAASYALSCAASSQHVAVVISPRVTPRSGDGENFPNVSGIELGEGQTVELLRQRGDWLQIKTKTGQRGWLPEQVLETI